MYAIIPAKTQASLLDEELLEYQSVRNRKSTIEPPPSRAQDSKIALGDAGPPKVLHNTSPASAKRQSLRNRI
jgi:hypothetical protein